MKGMEWLMANAVFLRHPHWACLQVSAKQRKLSVQEFMCYWPTSEYCLWLHYKSGLPNLISAFCSSPDK